MQQQSAWCSLQNAKRYDWQTYTRLAACTVCTASEVPILKTTWHFSLSQVHSS
jgi:hypothetical protein